MSSPEPEGSSSREARLDLVLADYLAAEDQGRPPAPDELIARHPEFAAELSEFCAGHERLRRLARPADPHATTPPGGEEQTRAIPAGPRETITTDLGPGAPTGSWTTDPGRTTDAESEADGPTLADGSRIRYFGDYELIKVLGRGGMGVVYRARQISLDRHVALKMIRADRLDGEDDLRRFRNEVEVVARLDHPNLLPVLEFGEHDGQRYFSMPLVVGGSLADHLGRFQAEPMLAARVMSEVADAVHHAHQRGILHRDLKPANVLLDAEGRPHVSDFGLAKRLDVDPELTQSGAILGTPAYMAPEQATGHRAAITTASDVYGLGGILYALLTGRPPLRGDSTVDLLRRVREEPPEPPSRINRRVGRGLETICLKCLEKDPRRRYDSAAALAEDLRRWMRGEPLAARPVGPVVRLALWCRRRPALATVGGLLILSVLAGIAGVAWQWRRAEHEGEVRRSIDNFFRETFLGEERQYDYAYRRQMTVEELFDEAAGRLDGGPVGPPEVEAGIQESIGTTYRALGRYDKAEKHLRRSLRLREEFLGPDDPVRLFNEQELASLLITLGQFDEAGPLATRAAEGLRRALGPQNPRTLYAEITRAQWLQARGRLEEAEAELRRLLRECELVLGPEADGTLRALEGLAVVIQQRGRAAEAEPLHRRHAEALRRKLRPDHPRVLHALNALGGNLILQEKYAAAEPVLAEALDASRRNAGPGNPDTLRVQTNLAALQFMQGRLDDAERTLRDAIAAQSKVLPDDHPEVLANLNTLASILVRRQDWAGAEPVYRRILQARESSVGRDHFDAAAARCQLGEVLIELGRAAEAAPMLASALPVYRTRLVGAGKGNTPAAEADAKRAAIEIGRVLTIYGKALLDDGRAREAESVLEEAVETRRSGLPSNHWHLANTESLHGEAIAAQRRFAEAEPILVRSYEAIAKARDALPVRVEQARRRLAKLYDDWGRPEQAAEYRDTPPKKPAAGP